MTVPTILVVGHVIPFPPAAGNEIRILKLVSWLRSQGFQVVMLLNHAPVSVARKRDLETVLDAVHFIGDDYESTFPAVAPAGLGSRLWRTLARVLPDSALYRAMFGLRKARKMQSEQIKSHLGSERLAQVTRHLCENYQPVAVIAEYVFAARCLDAVPRGVLKVIDTHDVFSRKAAEVLALGIDDPLPCSRREERHYLRKSDLVIAIQPSEARLLRRLAGGRDVITVGIDFEAVGEVDDSAIVPGTILVVGSDNPLNQHGFREFCRHAWPTVRAVRPEAVLRVVGKLANHVRGDEAGVQAVGWVARLDDEYRRAEVVINPTVVGTGLKIKSVEALCHAKALVGTPNSVDGIEAGGDAPYRVGRDWDEFAHAILALLEVPDERRRLQRRALEFARTHFSTGVTYAPLARRLWRLRARATAGQEGGRCGEHDEDENRHLAQSP